MQINVLLKIARQYDGEYVFIQAIKGFIDRVNLSNFIKTYEYSPAEKIEGVECVVELGTVEVEIGDIDDFFGKYSPANVTQAQSIQEKLIEWKNYNNLPVAKIISGTFPTLGNPEILEWNDLVDGKREGKGVVWIEQAEPLIALDPDTFIPTKYYGEIRLVQAFNKGRYGPVSVELAQESDFFCKENV